MFGTIVLIAALGFLFWQNFLKDASNSTKGANKETETKEIRLSSFTKEK